MKLVDANVLLYATDRNAAKHAAAKAWLDAAMNDPETLLIPWVSLLAYIRLTTHPRVFEHPLTTSRALEVVEGWLAQPNVVTPEPDARHPQRMRELLDAVGGQGGNLVNDAHLAALALQYNAVVVTFDADFGRFPGVRCERPSS